MADLVDLAAITGHKSISDMSDMELMAHLRQVREKQRKPERKQNGRRKGNRVVADRRAD